MTLTLFYRLWSGTRSCWSQWMLTSLSTPVTMSCQTNRDVKRSVDSQTQGLFTFCIIMLVCRTLYKPNSVLYTNVDNFTSLQVILKLSSKLKQKTSLLMLVYFFTSHVLLPWSNSTFYKGSLQCNPISFAVKRLFFTE